MELFYFPTAPYCRKVLLAIYEKAAPCTLTMVKPFEPGAMDRLRQEHQQPLGQIPMVRLDDGTYLRESSIIVEQMDLDQPAPLRLIPADPREALAVRALDRFGDAIVSSSSYLTWAKRKPLNPRSQQKIENALTSFNNHVRVLDGIIGDKTFLHGQQLTLADISVACALGDAAFWGKSDFSEHPNVQRWLAEQLRRDAWRRVLEESEPILAALPPLLS